ncbi:MAG: type II secretion system protein GspD [Planctomycetota bacterium]|jgi:hypothetical protein
MLGRIVKFTDQPRLARGFIILGLLCFGGCGDFFARKPIELETQVILKELREIEENPNVKNALPELYRRPAETIRVRDGAKLFYFCRHHPADQLAELVDSQFSEFFRTAPSQKHPAGQEYPRPTYSVSPNPATNQLIIHCPTSEEAAKLLEFLQKVDVPPIQVNIDCLILERFADVSMDWETSLTIDNLFGEKITLGQKEGPEFPGASLREPRRSLFGLDVGYWNQELAPHEFRLVVDVLISRGYLRILMNPKLETVNGRKATITAREYAPLDKIVSKPGFDAPFNLTDYFWVEDKLEVTPHVFADGSIGLETYIKLGSRSKPEGVVQTRIITERFVDANETRVEPGRSLVIGGLRKSVEVSVVRGAPFLKDLPVIGIFFSSKDVEEKASEVIFVLTPSISSGGLEYSEMMENVKRKRARPEYRTGLHEAITDPFGSKAYTEHVEQQAARAEFERLKAEIEKAEALQEVYQIKEKLLQTAEQVIAERAKAAEAHSQALKAKEEAERAKADAEQARKEPEKAKAENHQPKSETEKAKAEAEKAKVEAKETNLEAEKAHLTDEKTDTG